MNALSLSHYILDHYSNISPMKLQKLLYYVKVWGVVSNEHLLVADFEKWSYGPVNNEVYQEYKNFGKDPITKINHNGTQPPQPLKKTIDFILDCYTPYDALTLSAMTHEDKPWQETPLNTIISDKVIKSFYSKLPFAKNFPFDAGKPFYPVQTDLHYAYIFDMNKKDAESLKVYSSYNEYKQQLKKTQQQFTSWFKNIA